MAEADGWNYCTQVTGFPQDGDYRKIVTLEQGGMTWVGIRMFNSRDDQWMNNGEPDKATVVAWRDLPDPARGYWERGKFILPQGQKP